MRAHALWTVDDVATEAERNHDGVAVPQLIKHDHRRRHHHQSRFLGGNPVMVPIEFNNRVWLPFKEELAV